MSCVVEVDWKRLEYIKQRVSGVFEDAKIVEEVLKQNGITEKQIYNFIIVWVAIQIGITADEYVELIRDIESLYFLNEFGWYKSYGRYLQETQ